MNDLPTILLVVMGISIIAYAELQSETNVVSAVLENKGVKVTQKQTRASLNSDNLYRKSNVCFIIFLLILAAALFSFENLSGWMATGVMFSIISSAGLAFVMRAMALIRVINRLQTCSTEQRR